MDAVLCIDDSAECLAVRRLILEHHGYSVLTATTGSRGLKLLAENSVAAVLLDYKMPRMDGLAVAKVIRKRHGSVPIVLVSGYPGELPERLLELADAFIAKGQPTDVLLAALRRITPRPKPTQRDRNPRNFPLRRKIS